MHTITKKFSFSASHELNGLQISHPCSRLHGHNYEVTIILQSESLDEIGFVMDYRKLDLFKEWLDSRFDHRHLNDVVDFNPTAENLAKYIFDNWSKTYPILKAIEVSETPKTTARYECTIN